MNIKTKQSTIARAIDNKAIDSPGDRTRGVNSDSSDDPLVTLPTRVASRKRRRKRVVGSKAKSTLDAQTQLLLARPASAQATAIDQVLHSKTKAKKPSGQRGRHARYYDETRRPIVCLAFVFPFLIFYEIGSIWLGRDAFRSGIDQWLDQALRQIGFGQLVLLPLVAMAVMIVWHHRDQDHWKIRIPVLAGMLTEAFGLGLILFCAANAIHLLVDPSASVTANVSPSHWWASVVGLVGSGIYEELVFRILLLLPVIYGAGRLIANRKSATVFGMVAVSLLFAALHYNVFNPAGSQFELSSFVFRFVASIVFCVLFLFRGFGIAVGTHVAYDVLTQV
jgi:membrane protease YdiL (CAAX protease family)